MIQPPRGDVGAVNFPLLPGGHFMEASRGRHRAHVNWEVGTRELRFQHLAKALGPEKFRLETIKAEMVLCFESRPEEGKTLNMVPMIVSYENVRVNPAPFIA